MKRILTFTLLVFFISSIFISTGYSSEMGESLMCCVFTICAEDSERHNTTLGDLHRLDWSGVEVSSSTKATRSQLEQVLINTPFSAEIRDVTCFAPVSSAVSQDEAKYITLKSSTPLRLAYSVYIDKGGPENERTVLLRIGGRRFSPGPLTHETHDILKESRFILGDIITVNYYYMTLPKTTQIQKVYLYEEEDVLQCGTRCNMMEFVIFTLKEH